VTLKLQYLRLYALEVATFKTTTTALLDDEVEERGMMGTVVFNSQPWINQSDGKIYQKLVVMDEVKFDFYKCCV